MEAEPARICLWHFPQRLHPNCSCSVQATKKKQHGKTISTSESLPSRENLQTFGITNQLIYIYIHIPCPQSKPQKRIDPNIPADFCPCTLQTCLGGVICDQVYQLQPDGSRDLQCPLDLKGFRRIDVHADGSCWPSKYDQIWVKSGRLFARDSPTSCS